MLLSIGGNDAGFAEIGAACATPGAPDCNRSAQFWVNQLETKVLPRLEETYAAVRDAAQSAPIFVLTYPNVVGPRACSAIELSPGELAFVRDVFVRRLDQLIRYAAARAQLRVIDLQGALVGHRICDVRLKDAAVNFIALGRTRGSTVELSFKRLAGLAHGTFHPNVLGHDLLEDKVRPVVERALKGDLDPLPEMPKSGPPAFDFGDLDPPVAPEDFPPGTGCGEGVVSVMTPMSVKPDVSTIDLRDLRAGSRVCFRQAGGRWSSTDAKEDGTASVPVVLRDPGIGSINEVLAQEQAGAWKRLFVTRVVQEGEKLDPPKGNYLGLIVVLVVGGVGFAAAVIVRLIRRQRAPV